MKYEYNRSIRVQILRNLRIIKTFRTTSSEAL